MVRLRDKDSSDFVATIFPIGDLDSPASILLSILFFGGVLFGIFSDDIVWKIVSITLLLGIGFVLVKRYLFKQQLPNYRLSGHHFREYRGRDEFREFDLRNFQGIYFYRDERRAYLLLSKNNWKPITKTNDFIRYPINPDSEMVPIELTFRDKSIEDQVKAFRFAAPHLFENRPHIDVHDWKLNPFSWGKYQ